jgi:hypothetical protein
MYSRGIIRTISPSTKFSLQSSELDPPASECVPPWNQRGRGNSRLRVRGPGGPIRTTRKKAWHSVYSVSSNIIINLSPTGAG